MQPFLTSSMDHNLNEITLENGAKGLLINIPSAKLFSFEFEFRAEENFISDKKWEAPHLLEHVMFGANKQYPNSESFEEAIGKNGASSNGTSSDYDIVYRAECADFECERILRLLLLALGEPVFLQREFESEAANVREELIEEASDQFRLLSASLKQRYGLRSKTDLERLKLMGAVKLTDVTEYYQTTHTTHNMRFIIAGNFMPPGRREMLIGLLDKLRLPIGDKRFELPFEQPVKLRKPMLLKNYTSNGITFHLDSFMKRGLNNEQEAGLSLVDTLLTDTYFSRILGAARAYGLIYDINSGFEATQHFSNWWIEAHVSRQNAKPLFDIMAQELQKLREGDISVKEIEEAKSFQLGRYRQSNQTVDDTIASYSNRYYLDGTVVDYKRIPDRIKEVTRAGLNEIVRALFKDQIWGLGVAGNCDEDFTLELHERIAPLWDTI
jgi:predicted Zn-dependent peptidase